jgi:hypothetical protein
MVATDPNFKQPSREPEIVNACEHSLRGSGRAKLALSYPQGDDPRCGCGVRDDVADNSRTPPRSRRMPREFCLREAI